MDDDLTFGASIWGSSDPVLVLPPPPPTSSLHVADGPTFDDTQFSDDLDDFDNFDNFATPAESIGTAEDDDDFGDFGEAQAVANEGFGGADFGEQIAGTAYHQPLKLDPLPSRTELQSQINEILGSLWVDDASNALTDDSIREMEGTSQMLVTPERYSMANISPPP